MNPQQPNATSEKTKVSSKHDNFLATKILINLLPPEIIMRRKHNAKISLLNKVSIAALVVLIFFTSATISLRVSQSLQLKKSQSDLVYAQGQVNSLSQKGAQTALIKQKIEEIQQELGTDSKLKKSFNVITSMMPVSFKIYDMAIDRNGNINISLSSPSIFDIDSFFNDLMDPSKNGGIVSNVKLDGISWAPDSTYKFSIKILAKN